jgi:hypothetical protein
LYILVFIFFNSRQCSELNGSKHYPNSISF